MDHRLSPTTTPARAATARHSHEGFGLFGMGALQRLAISAAASALIAIAAWWALA